MVTEKYEFANIYLKQNPGLEDFIMSLSPEDQERYSLRKFKNARDWVQAIKKLRLVRTNVSKPAPDPVNLILAAYARL